MPADSTISGERASTPARKRPKKSSHVQLPPVHLIKQWIEILSPTVKDVDYSTLRVWEPFQKIERARRKNAKPPCSLKIASSEDLLGDVIHALLA